MTKRIETQKVPFRLIVMPCCNFQACWVNPRFPNYCPECGKFVFPEIKGCVTLLDEGAWLKYKVEE